jgi:ribonucleoside-triphosphate reductase
MKEMQSSGDFHIHDLGILGVYCVGWDIHDLLLEGFKAYAARSPAVRPSISVPSWGNWLISSLPAGRAAGAQAFSNFDTLLAPLSIMTNWITNSQTGAAGICLLT